jgi:hypothetical protein
MWETIPGTIIKVAGPFADHLIGDQVAAAMTYLVSDGVDFTVTDATTLDLLGAAGIRH